MNKQQILDKIESLELTLAELSLTLYTIRNEIEEGLTE